MRYTSVWIFLYLTLAVSVSSLCNGYSDCVTCTNSHSWYVISCRWCPLDRQCHAYGSILNACESHMNIKDQSNCYNGSEKSDTLFSPENAFVGTLLSAAAYSENPEQCLKQMLPNMDFQLVDTVEMKCDDFLFDSGNCFAYIAISHTLKTIVLAYRGTTSVKQLIDEILTVLFIPKQNFVAGGEVQEYFKNAHDKLYPCIKDGIAELVNEYPHYNVTITGHSLGGAIASLASAHLMKENILSQNEIYLYTFGMPRVGNKRYALEHDKLVRNSWRIVHYRDIVSHLPTCNWVFGCNLVNGPFHHGTEIYYRSEEMKVSSDFKICRGNEDNSCSDGEIEAHKCKLDMDICIENHKYYYGIDMRDHCNNFNHSYVIKRRFGMTNFPNDTCQRKRFPYLTNKTS